MRKLLELISIAAIADILWQTYPALYGPNRIIFSSGWDPTGTILVIPLIAITLFLLITGFGSLLPALRHKLANTPTTQVHPMPGRLGLSVWIKAEIMITLAVDQYAGLQFARIGTSYIHQALLLTRWNSVIFGVAIAVTMTAYWTKSRRLALAQSSEPAPDANASPIPEPLAGHQEER